MITRDFLLLWQAQLVSQFGNQAFMIAMTFWTASTTRSATMTGLVLMAGVLPVVLIGSIADLTGRNVPLVYAICGGLALATVILLTLRPTSRSYLTSA